MISLSNLIRVNFSEVIFKQTELGVSRANQGIQVEHFERSNSSKATSNVYQNSYFDNLHRFSLCIMLQNISDKRFLSEASVKLSGFLVIRSMCHQYKRSSDQELQFSFWKPRCDQCTTEQRMGSNWDSNRRFFEVL